MKTSTSLREIARSIGFLLFLFPLISSGFGQDVNNLDLARAPSKEGVVKTIAGLRQRSLTGDSHAQYSLGRVYVAGTDVARDYRQAANWYHAAAPQGLADAQFALAYLYEEGEGVPKNYHQAATLYRAAAKQGHTVAQNNLGSMYEYGRGVRKSLTEAANLYLLAAHGGLPSAQSNLTSLYFRGRGVTREIAASSSPQVPV